jgi:hypothetical protein
VTYDSLSGRAEGPANDDDDELDRSEFLLPVAEADVGPEETQNGDRQCEDPEHDITVEQEEEPRGRSASPASVMKRPKSPGLITDASSAAAWSGDEDRSPS